MGYPGKGMWSTCVFRPGRAPYPGIAQPPGHRLAPDHSHPLRKTLLHIGNKFFWFSHFQISPNSEKRCRNRQNRDFGSSEAYFNRKTVPQESESASVRSARRFPTFPCVRWSRDNFPKTNNSKNPKNAFGQISYKTFTCPR